MLPASPPAALFLAVQSQDSRPNEIASIVNLELPSPTAPTHAFPPRATPQLFSVAPVLPPVKSTLSGYQQEQVDLESGEPLTLRGGGFCCGILRFLLCCWIIEVRSLPHVELTC